MPEPSRCPVDARESGPARWYLVLALGTLYWVTGRLGLSLAHYQDNATLIWPPTGLALAALVLCGRRMWWGIFLGTLAVNLTAPTQPPGWSMVTIAVGNTLEALAGAWLLERVAFNPALARLRDVFAFVLIGVMGCTMVGASVGVASLAVFGGLDDRAAFSTVWVIWWLGDAGGALVFAPLVMMIARGSPPWRQIVGRVEACGLLFLLLLSASLAFGREMPRSTALLLAFAPFPLLAWAGGRFGARGAVIASAIISVAAVSGTASGCGPFTFEGLATDVMLLWCYSITVGCVALALAAAIAERERSEAHLLAEVENRIELERRIEQQQRLESLGLLAGGVAHDFNNILTTIRGNAELLEPAVRSDESAGSMLFDLKVAAERAAELCHQLLAYSGDRRTAKKRIVLADLVREIETMLGPAIPASVTVDSSGIDPGVVVVGDPPLLRQVLMNLVLNSAQALAERGGTIWIEGGVLTLGPDELAGMLAGHRASRGRFCCITVQDDGPGMTVEEKARIFDPFFSTKVSGRGLGLAVVLGIVQSHEGAIEVVTAPGRGAEFRVYLPEVEASDTSLFHPGADTAGVRGRTILVADDDPGLLAFAVRALESAGFEVEGVADGEAALRAFEARPDSFDLLLFDVTMPRCDGDRALDVIREVRPQIAAVLMSGHDSNERRARRSKVLFLPKPFTNRQLLGCVRKALRATTAADSTR